MNNDRFGKMDKRLNRSWPSGLRCMFCKHWFDLSLSHGDCRRFPAKVVTSYSDWCAEFSKHEETP